MLTFCEYSRSNTGLISHAWHFSSKAVALRLKQKSTNRNHSQPLLELSGGDQLEKKNIDRAIVEVDLKSLYSSSNIDLGKSAKITQLYFGPGFEDRLELEMDE